MHISSNAHFEWLLKLLLAQETTSNFPVAQDTETNDKFIWYFIFVPACKAGRQGECEKWINKIENKLNDATAVYGKIS